MSIAANIILRSKQKNIYSVITFSFFFTSLLRGFQSVALDRVHGSLYFSESIIPQVVDQPSPGGPITLENSSSREEFGNRL